MQKSNINWTNINWDEADKNVAINTDPGERRFMVFDRLVPKRRFNRGPKPKMTGRDIRSKNGEGGIQRLSGFLKKNAFKKRKK